MAVKIGIIGAGGRMGQAIAALASEAGAELMGGVDQGDSPGAARALAERSNVLIDFSAPSALADNLAAALDAETPILIGTTGLGADEFAAIDKAAASVAVLQTGNTSLGVNLLSFLVREAAARLGPDWDIEIVEMHHRMKRDAPSGTALLLGEAAAEGRGAALDALAVTDRTSQPAVRKEGTIGFVSLRGGTVAGEHEVILAGDEERIALSHSAENRSVFARGALRGAAWLVGQPAGRYTMADVLGL